METIIYTDQDRQVSWHGVSMADGVAFNSFMVSNVASRLHDKEGANEFEKDMRYAADTVADTGFARDSLDKLLAAEILEERNWAIGEAMAEAYLALKHDVIWPWNMERDKRNSYASLPGADLVGFEINGKNIRLLIGEVKTSGDTNTPPNTMYGRSGMTHQIDNLANKLESLHKLLRWLHPRCKGTKYEKYFRAAMSLFLESGNKAVTLFGVLVRDTDPNKLDLQSRGRSLAGTLHALSTCKLIALYLPCAIGDLSVRIRGGE